MTPRDLTVNPHEDPPKAQGILPAAAPVPGAPLRRGGSAPPSDWLHILSAIRTYKWVVTGVTVVGTTAGVVGARFIKPTYEARAIIWVEMPDHGRPGAEGPIASGQLLGSSSGWLEVLRSHAVLDDVVRRERLYLKLKSADDAPIFATFGVTETVRVGTYRLDVDPRGASFALVDAKTGATLERGALGDSVGRAQGFTWVPGRTMLRSGTAVVFSVMSLGDAAVKLAEDLRIRQSSDGNFVRVELRISDPNLAAATVNAVVDRVVTVALDLKRQKLSELTRILSDQLQHARVSLQDADAAVTSFRVRHATRTLGGPATATGGREMTADPTFARYMELKGTADEFARERQAIADVLTQVQDSGLAVDALAWITAVQRSADLNEALRALEAKQAELRALRFRYADTHPPVRHLAAEVDTLQRQIIPALARALIARLAARERELITQVDSLSRELRSAPPAALEEARLERDRTNAQLLFSTLQQRSEETRLAEVSTLPDVRILERAPRPDRPVANLGPLLILLAFVGSLGLGTVGAVMLERVDPRARNPDRVSRAMGLPILGALPHVPRRNGKRRAAEEETAKAVEALRGIRLNVQHAYGAAGPVLITVTSPGRSEGKSFVTSNLARTFADVGFRTLLIDGDVRLGALHRALKRGRRPGLTDVLSGGATLTQVVQNTPHPLLWFIGAGSRMHRGPELLCSAAVPRLLTALRASYEAILVDSAPLAAGVDPYALGTATGSLLLVLRTGVTDRAIAAAKVEGLQRLPIRLLGAVLNDVPHGSTYSYYSYSLMGYEVRDEDPKGTPGEILLLGSP